MVIIMSMIAADVHDPAEQFLQFLHTLGLFLQYDDRHDIGKFDRLHHWQYGFILEQLSVLLSVINVANRLLDSLKEDQPVNGEDPIDSILSKLSLT